MKYIPEVDKQALQESLSQKFVCFLFCRVQNMSMRSWMWVCWDYLYKFIFIQRLCLFHKTGFSQCDLCSDWSKIKNVWISSCDCTKRDTQTDRQSIHYSLFFFLISHQQWTNRCGGSAGVTLLAALKMFISLDVLSFCTQVLSNESGTW